MNTVLLTLGALFFACIGLVYSFQAPHFGLGLILTGVVMICSVFIINEIREAKKDIVKKMQQHIEKQ